MEEEGTTGEAQQKNGKLCLLGLWLVYDVPIPLYLNVSIRLNSLWLCCNWISNLVVETIYFKVSRLVDLECRLGTGQDGGDGVSDTS
jgi:hypothetical protein